MASLSEEFELGEWLALGLLAVFIAYKVSGSLGSFGSWFSSLGAKTSAAVTAAGQAVSGSPISDSTVIGDSGLTVGYLKGLGYTDAQIAQVIAQSASDAMASTVPGDYTSGGVPSPF